MKYLKDPLYLIHIPTLLLGAVIGTVYVGIAAGFRNIVYFWES